MVMLTRISIKVRLAWSTVAQMGFMILECALGLYTLAALHLIGHSLYKAHAFLSASSIVRESKLQMLRGHAVTAPPSLLVAPALSLGIVTLVQSVGAAGAWPWWWNGVLALAWAPLLWLPSTRREEATPTWSRAIAGMGLVAGLTLVAALAHKMPLGVSDAPHFLAGYLTLAGMALMYLCLTIIQWRPQRLAAWRRWSYAGFYVDEFYTSVALSLWPTRWTTATTHPPLPGADETAPAVATK
jgi:NAD(P)H-quinone oxidoreductase subunit 5